MNRDDRKEQKKHSRKREAILRLIRSTGSHPGARWVYEQLKPEIPDLSLGTVYRNINLFRAEGDVAFLGVVRGEERFDGRVEPHPHAVCRRCGKIADLPEDIQAELFTGLPPGEPVRIPDFSLDMRNTVFYGLCKACLEETTA
ncbi:MAG: transcriptional repressor [Treponema sp.]|jgi:Fur family peroxide stress response transcriptional regulator|nr:transcriptional repressor [Treponema sp.]